MQQLGMPLKIVNLHRLFSKLMVPRRESLPIYPLQTERERENQSLNVHLTIPWLLTLPIVGLPF